LIDFLEAFSHVLSCEGIESSGAVEFEGFPVVFDSLFPLSTQVVQFSEEETRSAVVNLVFTQRISMIDNITQVLECSVVVLEKPVRVDSEPGPGDDVIRRPYQ